MYIAYMVVDFLNLDRITDAEFNKIYPARISKLANRHWTPVEIAMRASEFLAVKPETRVLDVGSGVGKFCMIGASHTKGFFTGIEQRADLVNLAKRLASDYQIHNVDFIHSNITSINFTDYQAFYFYNSFQENIDSRDRIDTETAVHAELFHVYSMYIFEQFASLPSQTRLVTYCGSSNIVPSTFQLKHSLYDGFLKFWEKL